MRVGERERERMMGVCVCWDVCASFVGIRLHREGFSEKMAFGLSPKYAEQTSYGKFRNSD